RIGSGVVFCGIGSGRRWVGRWGRHRGRGLWLGFFCGDVVVGVWRSRNTFVGGSFFVGRIGVPGAGAGVVGCLVGGSCTRRSA
ncbi:MAG: hypothetical protein RML72_01440, partial [Bacteroidia bacterium]|nr:hypothetical protein [Bacteroidia bacterium]